jgi:KDO2-lipid IV(A) lauroyltransferase
MEFIAKVIGAFLYKIDKSRKKVVFANFDLVFPDMPQDQKIALAKKVYRNFAYNVLELIRNRFISKKELAKKVEFVNLDSVKEYLDKPVVFISAHYGNWEMLPLILGGVLEIPMTVVVRDIDIEFVNRFFKKNRERFNIKTVDKKGALRVLIKDARKRSIGIFVDQNTPRKKGVDVEMFGLKALQTPSAALIAKKFDLPIIPVFIQRFGKRYKVIFKEPIFEKDIDKSVQAQSDIIEQMIKEKKDEWYWFHRRFKYYYKEVYKNKKL